MSKLKGKLFFFLKKKKKKNQILGFLEDHLFFSPILEIFPKFSFFVVDIFNFFFVSFWLLWINNKNK